MAEQIYYSVFTKQGLALLTEAIQNGTKLGITSMAFGDGGGSLPVPNENFTSMVREVHRTQLNSLAPDPNNANWLRADAIIASATGGFNIRELGLYAGNVLVAYSNYPPTYKPNPSDGTARIMSFRMILQIDNTANFDLVIDPDVVLATIQKVEDAKLEIYQNTATTLYQLSDLENFEKWPGRTVFIKTRNGEENSFFSGNFIYDESSTEDIDNALILSAGNVGRWRRVLKSNILQAQWFGHPNQIDDQKILNAAFFAANKRSMQVDIRGSVWGINGVVNGIYHLQIFSDRNSYISVNPDGNYPQNYAVLFGNPDSTWTDGRSLIRMVGCLRIDCQTRSKRLNGVVFKGSWHSIDAIRVENFNGTGLNLESVHDSVFPDISVELCGNNDDYAFRCSSIDDTTNCLHIGRLQVEQSYQRGIYMIKTIRSLIDNIHAERLYITNKSSFDNVVGRDKNHLINIDNSQINQAIFHSDSENDFYVRLDGTLSVMNAVLVHGHCFGEYGSSLTFNTLQALSYGQHTMQGSMTFNNLTCNKLGLTSNVVINNIKAEDFIFGFQASKIIVNGGSIKNVGSLDSSEVAEGQIQFNRLNIENVYKTGSNSSAQPTIFSACKIQNFYGDPAKTCTVVNSSIENCDLATVMYATFESVKFTNFKFNGSAAFITRNCSATGSVNWSLPTVKYAAGSLSERIGYSSDGKIYQNTDGDITWQKLL